MIVQRVTEIRNPNIQEIGTGYLIRNNFILTAYHIVKNSDVCNVRFYGDYKDDSKTLWEWRKGTANLCWKDRKNDLALLQYTGNRPSFINENESDIKFGILDNGKPFHLAKGCGFPEFNVIDNKDNLEWVEGKLNPFSHRTEGKLRLDIDSHRPKPFTEEEIKEAKKQNNKLPTARWAGMSGAALFVEEVLVGVVIETDRISTEKSLLARPIFCAIKDEKFCKHIFNNPRPNNPLIKISDIDLSKVNWRTIGIERLKLQKKLPTNQLISKNDFEIDDLYIEPKLAEIKQQQSKNQNNDNIGQEYEYDEFLTQIIGKENNSINNHKRIAIIGEPGAGKTTLLRKIGFSLSDNIDDAIIISVSLGDLIKDLKIMNLYEYIYLLFLDAAATQISKAEVTDNIKDDFISQFKQNRIWLLLDGLDEMSVIEGDALKEIANQIKDNTKLLQANIVITCRDNLWNDNNKQNELRYDLDFKTYTTLKFSDLRRRESFIKKWFFIASKEKKEEKAKDLCIELRRKEDIQDLVKNPLLLTLLCHFWEWNRGELPDTKTELYESFVSSFNKWKPGLLKPKTKTKTKIDLIKEFYPSLGNLAKEAIDSDSYRFNLEEAFVSEYLGNLRDKNSLHKLAVDLGWLNRNAFDSRGNSIYTFFHASFQEYFAALAINKHQFFFQQQKRDNSKSKSNKDIRVIQYNWIETIKFWLGRKEENLKAEQTAFFEAALKYIDESGLAGRDWSDFNYPQSNADTLSYLLDDYCFCNIEVAIPVLGNFLEQAQEDRHLKYEKNNLITKIVQILGKIINGYG